MSVNIAGLISSRPVHYWFLQLSVRYKSILLITYSSSVENGLPEYLNSIEFLSAQSPNPDLLFQFIFAFILICKNVNNYYIRNCRISTINNFCLLKNICFDKLLLGRRETPKLGSWLAPRIYEKAKLHSIIQRECSSGCECTLLEKRAFVRSCQKGKYRRGDTFNKKFSTEILCVVQIRLCPKLHLRGPMKRQSLPHGSFKVSTIQQKLRRHVMLG